MSLGNKALLGGKSPERDGYLDHQKEKSLNKITVDIMGTQYTIKGDAESNYIYELSKYVNEKMAEIASSHGNINTTKVAILAALNIADEYFQHKEICESGMAKVEKKTLNMISLIDQGIIGDIYP